MTVIHLKAFSQCLHLIGHPMLITATSACIQHTNTHTQTQHHYTHTHTQRHTHTQHTTALTVADTPHSLSPSLTHTHTHTPLPSVCSSQHTQVRRTQMTRFLGSDLTRNIYCICYRQAV